MSQLWLFWLAPIAGAIMGALFAKKFDTRATAQP